MTKRLIFNGFSMNAVSHIFHGTWRRPDTRQTEFNDLDTWVSLLRVLEKGKFDSFFLADIIGVDPAYKGSWDTYIKEAVQIPINDFGRARRRTDPVDRAYWPDADEFDFAGASV